MYVILCVYLCVSMCRLTTIIYIYATIQVLMEWRRVAIGERKVNRIRTSSPITCTHMCVYVCVCMCVCMCVLCSMLLSFYHICAIYNFNALYFIYHIYIYIYMCVFILQSCVNSKLAW